MRVLVLESEPGAADATVAALQAAQHTVERCHEPDEPGFPCRAIDEPGQCPLTKSVIDVALTVRGRNGEIASEFEDGVACAIRAGVPLVVAGAVDGNPYVRWASATVAESDAVDACVWSASAPLERHSRVATEKLRGALEHHDIEGAQSAEVEVRRLAGRLKVVARVPVEAPWRECELALTGVVASLREIDRAAAGIDVSLAPCEPG